MSSKIKFNFAVNMPDLNLKYTFDELVEDVINQWDQQLTELIKSIDTKTCGTNFTGLMLDYFLEEHKKDMVIKIGKDTSHLKTPSEMGKCKYMVTIDGPNLRLTFTEEGIHYLNQIGTSVPYIVNNVMKKLFRWYKPYLTMYGCSANLETLEGGSWYIDDKIRLMDAVNNIIISIEKLNS